MGSFDCYCALCSGPLGVDFISFGSNEKKALARRRRRVENKRRSLAGEDDLHEDLKQWKDQEMIEDEKIESKGAKIIDASVGRDANIEVPEQEDAADNEGDEETGSEDDGPWDSNEESIATIEEELASGADSSDNEEKGQEGEDEALTHVSDNNSDEYNENDSDDGDEDWNEEDSLVQDSELSLPNDFDFACNSRDETDRLYSYHEEHSYDPEKLTREDIQWTDRCRVLGINNELRGKKRAFISGRGRYSDSFDFNIKSSGSDQRDPYLGEHPVYHCYEPESSITTFPFHEECFKLLTRCLGYESRKQVDKDVLYAVMMQNAEELATNLELDYGRIEGAEQCWESYAGEEWSVMDPGTKVGVEEVVKSMLPATLFGRPEVKDLDLSHKVKHDPLTVLPYDILYGIFTNLCLEDTLSLVKASWHVFDSTRESAFCRQMIRLHIVPFFWELDGVLRNNTFPDTFDWKGLFPWLNKITEPTYAMEGPLMAIANRRRIWNVCQQLAPQYHENIDAESYVEPDDVEAAAILETAEQFHMPVTMFPQPATKEIREVSAQFLRSWSEVGYHACDLDTYWTGKDHGLVGVSMNFGTAPRIFGSTKGVKGQSLHIKAGEWIREIKVAVANISFYQGDKARENSYARGDVQAVDEAFIVGMTICLTSGQEKHVKAASYDRCERSYKVLPGMHFIGLTGEVAPNGIISRFALLQAPDPATPPRSNTPKYTTAQTLLYSSRSSHAHSISTGKGHPIHCHPDLTLHTLRSPLGFPSPSYLHRDMLPYQTLLWAKDPSAYKVLTRISTLELADENGPSSILCLWYKTTSPYGFEEHIGSCGPVPAQMPQKWAKAKSVRDLDLHKSGKSWDEEYMKHFEVDGPGGEVVVEVHVAKNRRGFQVVTNKGRVGTFGEPGEWDIVAADTERGQVVLGLSCCFGNLGGWSEGASTWSHWGVGGFGVVLSKKRKTNKVA